MSKIEDKIIRFICKNWMITLVIIATVAFYIYVTYFPLKEMHYARMLNDNIASAVEENQTNIAVKDLVDFRWDKVCFVRDQESHRIDRQSRIYEILGEEYLGYLPSFSCQNDSSFFTNSFLFIKDSKAIMILPVYDCRMSSVKSDTGCFSANSFIEVKDGKPWPNLSGHEPYEPYKELILTDSP